MTEQQFNEVYREKRPILVGKLKKFIGNKQTSEDLVQDIFIALWIYTNNGTNWEMPRIKSYLFGIVRASIRNWNQTRDKNYYIEIGGWGGIEEQISGKYINPKEELRLANRIDEEINNLPQYLRWPMYKKYIEGKHNFFVSEELDIPRQLVKAYIGRGREKLRQSLKDEYYK